MTNNEKTVRIKMINIGIIDRMLRFNLGFAIMLISVVALYVNGAVPVWLHEEASMPTWAYIGILVSIYPATTAIFGYDPFYALIRKDTLEAFLPEDAYMHTETKKQS